jgi:polyhydroxyalkanoate synthesis regulator phasin
MARAVGKDVLLDLMDEVKRLGEVQVRQQATIERMEQRLDLMVEHARALSDDLTLLRADVTQLGATCAELSTGLKRVTGVLVKAIDSTSDRFDDLEARVTRLEKKSA